MGVTPEIVFVGFLFFVCCCMKLERVLRFKCLMGFMDQENVWDAIAEKWAEFRVSPLGEVVNFLEKKSGKVLDLGCGSGRHYLESKELRFYGVDFSKELLDFAKGKNYVELKKGVVWDIPYENDFFDFVLFSRVLHCVDSEEKRKKSLEEVYRVLKIKGEALVSVWGRGSERLKNRDKESFVPWSVNGKKVGRYTYIYDEDELVRDLESVGFKIVKSWGGKSVGAVVRK